MVKISTCRAIICMSAICLMMAVAISSLPAFAAAPALAWEKSYGGPGNERPGTSDGHALVAVSDGYVMTGWTNSFTNDGNSDIYLVKTDLNGNQIWNKSYGGPDDEYGESIAAVSDGFVIAGYNYTGLKAILIKTDLNGNLQWEKVLTVLPRGTRAYSVVAVADGYVVTGETSDGYYYGPHLKAFLVKTDLNGDIVWSQTYGGSGEDAGYAVAAVADGYVVTGYSYSYGASMWGNVYNQVWLFKTDLNGVLQWNKTYGETDPVYGQDVYDEGNALAVASDGYYITGYTMIDGDDGLMYVIKADLNGNLLWNKTSTMGYQGTSVIALPDGCLVAGTPSVDNGIYLEKYLASGTKEWAQSYCTESQFGPFSIISANDAYFVTGSSGGNLSLVKLGSSGSGTPTPTPTPPHVNSVAATGSGTVTWVYDDPEGSPQAGFQVEYRTGAEGAGSLVWSTSGTGSGVRSIGYGGSSLTNDMTYYVRVRITDGTGWSGWYETSFVAIVSPTPTPTPTPAPAPAPVSTPPRLSSLTVTNADSGHPTFNWTYYDPEGSPQLVYKIDVWTGPGASGELVWNPPPTAGSSGSVTYGGGHLVNGQRYYAKVSVSDGTGWSEWKEVSWIAGGSAVSTPTPAPTSVPGGNGGAGEITPAPTSAPTPTPTPVPSASPDQRSPMSNPFVWGTGLLILAFATGGIWWYMNKK